MEDNEKFSVDTEQLKNETKDTVNQVKDTIKGVDFKKDTVETTNFLKEMFVNPFETIRKVANDEENILKKALIIMILFIASGVICKIISLTKYGKYSSIGNNLLGIVASFLNPIFFIVVPAIVVLIFNTKNKKSLITIISTLIIANIPVVVTYVIDIIEVLVSGISIITGPISTALSALAIVFTYFGMKELFNEDTEKFFKKFAIIKLVSAFILVILSRVGIY